MSLKIEHSKIKDVLLIRPNIFKDHRGEYVETWNEEKYSALMRGNNFVQDDISISFRNVLRGLHGDTETWKLVQCLLGSFFLVVLDVREGSESYLQWDSFCVSEINRHQILIPAGCLNGHLCLSERCVFSYKQTTYYNPMRQSEIRYNSFDIKWPNQIGHFILSERDSISPYYANREDYIRERPKTHFSHSADMGGTD